MADKKTEETREIITPTPPNDTEALKAQIRKLSGGNNLMEERLKRYFQDSRPNI